MSELQVEPRNETDISLCWVLDSEQFSPKELMRLIDASNHEGRERLVGNRIIIILVSGRKQYIRIHQAAGIGLLRIEPDIFLITSKFQNEPIPRRADL